MNRVILAGSVIAAITLILLAWAPGTAYGGTTFPTINPSSITTSLFQDELGQFATSINPNNSEDFEGMFTLVDERPNCDFGFLDNISIQPVIVGPTPFDWRLDITPNTDAIPGEYVCTLRWNVFYFDDAGNNFTNNVDQEITITVLSLTIDVDIDIKPGSDPNAINLNKKKGSTPVAILGSASFDVTDIDVTTLTFGPGAALPRHDLTDVVVYASHLEDVNSDGLLDLVVHFNNPDTGISPGDTEACVDGALNDSTPINGCDDIKTIPSS